MVWVGPRAVDSRIVAPQSEGYLVGDVVMPGQREFTVQDWANLLTDLGQISLKDCLFSELAQYKGISVAQVQGKAQIWREKYRREWNDFLRTGKNPKAFYKSQDTEVYALCEWHGEFGAVRARLEAMNYGLGKEAKKVLDFGSGIGSDAIVLAKLGFETTLADVSSTMLAFAKWRLEKRGLAAQYIDLNSGRIPPSDFDMAVSFDVIEHIPISEVPACLSAIRSSLKPGGAYFMTVSTALDEPSHITSPEEVLRVLRRAGFSWDYAREGYACKRAERSVFVNYVIGAYDYARFSIPILRRWLSRRLELFEGGRAILRVYRGMRVHKNPQ